MVKARQLDGFSKTCGAHKIGKQFLSAARKVVRESAEFETQGITKYKKMTERTLEVLLMRSLPKVLMKKGIVANQVRDGNQTVADIALSSSNHVKGGMVIELKKDDAKSQLKGEVQLKGYMLTGSTKYKYGMLLVFPGVKPDEKKVWAQYYQRP